MAGTVGGGAGSNRGLCTCSGWDRTGSRAATNRDVQEGCSSLLHTPSSLSGHRPVGLVDSQLLWTTKIDHTYPEGQLKKRPHYMSRGRFGGKNIDYIYIDYSFFGGGVEVAEGLGKASIWPRVGV